MTRRRYFTPVPDAVMFQSMNTTPLIDVLLVLLVMMIITLPLQVHKVPLEIPGGAASGVPPVTHRLSIAQNGAYAWDGAPVTGASLPARLGALQSDPARPVLVLDVDGQASYDVFAHTLATVERAGVTRLGFSGNQRWAKW